MTVASAVALTGVVMTRFLASVVWPYAYISKRRLEHREARDKAVRDHDRACTAALARGEYFRPTLADDIDERW